MSPPLLLLLLILLLLPAAAINEALTATLTGSLSKTTEALQSIWAEWQIDKFPAFLKSASMHKSAYELLRLKFAEKILLAHASGSSTTSGAAATPTATRFVISFLGSSVAAGHDSHFNFSYPVVVGDLMRESLQAGGVTLDARNMALGNNPCFPYDICVKVSLTAAP